jgi:hypothetical protein
VNRARAAYLLLAAEHVLDEVHGALVERRHVHLALLGQHVVDVQLALHLALELAPGHGDLALRVVLVDGSAIPTTQAVLEILSPIVICHPGEASRGWQLVARVGVAVRAPLGLDVGGLELALDQLLCLGT